MKHIVPYEFRLSSSVTEWIKLQWFWFRILSDDKIVEAGQNEDSQLTSENEDDMDATRHTRSLMNVLFCC